MITVSPEQLKRAGEGPARGRPAFSALYPGGNPTEVAHCPVSVSKNFLNLGASGGCVLGEAMDPLASALKAAKFVKVDPGGFRALDEKARLLRPLI